MARRNKATQSRNVVRSDIQEHNDIERDDHRAYTDPMVHYDLMPYDDSTGHYSIDWNGNTALNSDPAHNASMLHNSQHTFELDNVRPQGHPIPKVFVNFEGKDYSEKDFWEIYQYVLNSNERWAKWGYEMLWMLSQHYPDHNLVQGQFIAPPSNLSKEAFWKLHPWIRTGFDRKTRSLERKIRMVRDERKRLKQMPDSELATLRRYDVPAPNTTRQVSEKVQDGLASSNLARGSFHSSNLSAQVNTPSARANTRKNRHIHSVQKARVTKTSPTRASSKQNIRTGLNPTTRALSPQLVNPRLAQTSQLPLASLATASRRAMGSPLQQSPREAHMQGTNRAPAVQPVGTSSAQPEHGNSSRLPITSPYQTMMFPPQNPPYEVRSRAASRAPSLQPPAMVPHLYSATPYNQQVRSPSQPSPFKVTQAQAMGPPAPNFRPTSAVVDSPYLQPPVQVKQTQPAPPFVPLPTLESLGLDPNSPEMIALMKDIAADAASPFPKVFFGSPSDILPAQFDQAQAVRPYTLDSNGMPLETRVERPSVPQVQSQSPRRGYLTPVPQSLFPGVPVHNPQQAVSADIGSIPGLQSPSFGGPAPEIGFFAPPTSKSASVLGKQSAGSINTSISLEANPPMQARIEELRKSNKNPTMNSAQSTQGTKRKAHPTLESQPAKKQHFIDLTGSGSNNVDDGTAMYNASTSQYNTDYFSYKNDLHDNALTNGVNMADVEIGDSIENMQKAWLAHRKDLSNAQCMLNPPDSVLKRMAQANAGQTAHPINTPEPTYAAALNKVRSGAFDAAWSGATDDGDIAPATQDTLNNCVTDVYGVTRAPEEPDFHEEKASLLWEFSMMNSDEE